MIEDFSICHRCQLHLELGIFREFSKKFETARMVYTGVLGKLMHEKIPEVEKSRDTVPLRWL